MNLPSIWTTFVFKNVNDDMKYYSIIHVCPKSWIWIVIILIFSHCLYLQIYISLCIYDCLETPYGHLLLFQPVETTCNDKWLFCTMIESCLPLCSGQIHEWILRRIDSLNTSSSKCLFPIVLNKLTEYWHDLFLFAVLIFCKWLIGDRPSV